MERLTAHAIATSAAIVLTVSYGVLGLQSSWWRTFTTINVVTCNVGCYVGLQVKRQSRKRRELRDVYAAIGRIEERYALTPGNQDVLVALREVKGELQDGRL